MGIACQSYHPGAIRQDSGRREVGIPSKQFHCRTSTIKRPSRTSHSISRKSSNNFSRLQPFIQVKLVRCQFSSQTRNNSSVSRSTTSSFINNYQPALQVLPILTVAGLIHATSALNSLSYSWIFTLSRLIRANKNHKITT